MSDPSRHPDSDQSDHRPRAGVPRLIYTFGVGVVIAVVVLIVILHVTGVLGAESH